MAGTELPRSPAASCDDSPGIDIFEWYPFYQSCQRYFLDHAQRSGPVQAMSAFLNIRLPFQKHPDPLLNSTSPTPSAAAPSNTPSITPTSFPLPTNPLQQPPTISLIPYIRRLVATGMDSPGVLHGFFGDDWQSGVGPIHEQERRNYMFAAKSGGWAIVKKEYSDSPQETIPFLRPLQGSSDAEIEAAEARWSHWLAMEDWMVGPRALDDSP